MLQFLKQTYQDDPLNHSSLTNGLSDLEIVIKLMTFNSYYSENQWSGGLVVTELAEKIEIFIIFWPKNWTCSWKEPLLGNWTAEWKSSGRLPATAWTSQQWWKIHAKKIIGQSLQWIGKGSWRPNSAWQSSSNVKVMFNVFLPRYQTVNSKYTKGVLQWLQKKIAEGPWICSFSLINSLVSC